MMGGGFKGIPKKLLKECVSLFIGFGSRGNWFPCSTEDEKLISKYNRTEIMLKLTAGCWRNWLFLVFLFEYVWKMLLHTNNQESKNIYILISVYECVNLIL